MMDGYIDARAGAFGRPRSNEAQPGSIKAAILRILWDDPQPAYDILRAIEQQRGLRPSPGTVYPALRMLEAGEFITGNERNGKWVYAIAPKGSALLAKLANMADLTTSHT